MRAVLPVVILAIVGCKQQAAEPVPAQQTPPPVVAPPPSAEVGALPLIDIAGFVSGEYHTSSNLPTIYFDRARELWVMSGRYGRADVADASAATFEAFLLTNGYAVDGKPKGDHMQHVNMNGSDMVVTTMADLMPEMPADLRAHYSTAQYDALENTRPRDLLVPMAKRAPLLWTSSAGIEVIGPDGTGHTFTLDKATDAFAALLALAHGEGGGSGAKGSARP